MSAQEPGEDDLGLGDEEGPAEEAPAEEAPAEPPADEGAPAEEPAPAEGDVGAEAGGEVGADAQFAAEAQASTDAAAEGSLAEDSEPVQTDAGEMVVTGTRIKRSEAFTASAPVEVIDRKALEYSGASNLQDAVQYMTVAQGTAIGTGAGVAGTTSINLRGLGIGATLMLVNGRRINPSGGGIAVQFADISTIPLAAVERIEILKGGASAIYGADAVGGVVNIITRKHFDGVRFELDGQTTEEFDNKDFTGSVAFGASSERGRLLMSGSYFRRTELNADDRDWTKGRYLSAAGWPGAIVPLGPPSATAPGGSPIAPPGPDPGCGAPGTRTAPMAATVGTTCWLDYRPYQSLLGNGERANSIATAEYDISDHTMFFGELTASRLRGDAVFSPSLPFPPPYIYVPANHPDNPAPMGAIFIGRPLGVPYGESRNTVSDDTLRGVLGIRGDLEDAGEGTVFESWEWELYATMGISRYRNSFPDNLKDPLLQAVAACGNPNDYSRCFNPFYTSMNGMGTPNSQAVIDGFSGEQVSMTDHAMQTYNAGLTGALFELPGGDLGFALGGEVRHEWRAVELDHDANLNRYAFLYGNTDASAERDVYGAYLEILWPFFDGFELQTAGRVENYTDTNATPISPSAGLTITPSEMVGRENMPDAFDRLQIRGHVTSAFRAPTLFQTFPGYATVPLSLVTGPPGSTPTYTPINTAGNPNLDPERALAITAGIVWTPIEEIQFMLDFFYYDYKDRIAAENAQQVVSADTSSRLSGGLGDQARVIRTGDPMIAPIMSPMQLGAVERVQLQQINVVGSVVTDGLDVGLMFKLNGKTFGGDVDDWGEFRFGGSGTYTMDFKIPYHQAAKRTLPGAMAGMMPTVLDPADCEGREPTSLCQVAGKRNETNFVEAIPKLKINFPVLYSVSGHQFAFIGHYISDLEDDVEVNADGSFDKIPSWFTLDVQYGYTLEDVIGDEFTIRIGMYNATDADPPITNGLTTPYEAGTHDVRGRMFYAKLIAEF